MKLTAVLYCSLLSLTVHANPEHNYYLDLGWHTPAGVEIALNRAESIVANDPDARVEILVHGNDIRLFANKLTQRRPLIVEHGANLAADGKVVFRVCEHALVYKSLDLDDLPSYFGVVYYVPERIKQMRDQGYSNGWSVSTGAE